VSRTRSSATPERDRRLDVVVVGGGITGLAAALELASRPECSWALVERDARWGGVVRTERHGSWLLEGGPDCFLSAKPGGLALCRELGLEDRLVGTLAQHRRTFVKRDRRLHRLPEGISGLVPSRLLPLVTAPTLSLPGRLRAALELFVPRSRNRTEQSIERFVSRRFGRETYDWLVEPLLSGIFAGDGEALSLDATFPRLLEAEREHGSVLRQVLVSRLREMTGAARDAAPAAPTGGFVTPRGGLGELVARVVERLPAERLRAGAGVASIERSAPGYRLALDDGTTLRARSVVLAIPAHSAAPALRALDRELAAELESIPFVATAIVSAGFLAGAVARPLAGYGYVSPRAEGGAVVACSCTTNKFPDRAAPGDTLFRFFLGRAGREEIARADDETIRAVVRQELREVLDITAEPVLWEIFRWPQALPQYNLGHLERIERIEARRATQPGLELAGASYRGVGIPDCIESGRRAARAAAFHALERASGQAPAEASARRASATAVVPATAPNTELEEAPAPT
jgi:oxygen-dependent protoporphyrinogen oxidase